MRERWLPVVGFEGFYEVSDLGRVRSLWFHNNYVDRARYVPLILSPGRAKDGRGNVGLCRNGFQRRESVAELVLEAFVGPCPPGMEACHWDGDARNDELSNLRWDTPIANHADKRRHGTQFRGSTSPNTSLTDDDVRCILAEPQFHGVCAMLARAFGVSATTIENIRGRRTWAHIEVLI
jgi:hypothetical protein